MNVTSNEQRQSTAEGGASGTRRRRIRPSRARGLRTRTGCLTCRERRVKCDDGKPKCLRCSKSDRICRYAPNAANAAEVGDNGESTRARPDSEEKSREGAHISDDRANRQQASIGTAIHYPSPFSAPAQDVVPLHRSDSPETPQDVHLNEYNEQSLPAFGSRFAESPQSLSRESLLNISPFEWYDLLARDAISHIQRLPHTSNGTSNWKSFEFTLSRKQSPAPETTGPQIAQDRREDTLQQHLPAFSDQDGGTDESSPVYPQSSTIWNTASRIELSQTDLKFFRYFIEVVGPILDLFDPARHFSNVVPHLALRNTGLLKSILAVGAKHMSLAYSHVPDGITPENNRAINANARATPAATGQFSDSESGPMHMATQYYYETLQYLSQTLLYPSYTESHEILATATLISTYEMFGADSAPSSSIWEQHLRGSFWIQRSQDNDGESVDGLRQAVWWAWLRQDIWAAFQAGRPTITFWRARKPLESLSADELATRILYLCGKSVKYAAANASLPEQDPRERIEQGDRLLCALDDWHRILPASYQPVTVAMDAASNSLFPSIWIHPIKFTGAMQMYYFARTAVLLNQPTLGGLSNYVQREKQLTECVKKVCGIAKSCQETEPSMAFVNVQALFAVGQFVRSPEMRDELLHILHNMLRISGFPAKGLIARLKKGWEE